ncbi:hypothetical protein C8Q80DRAFT_234555 [Daedaleopsis nitida]|nr:hypothetical protein C8Q80DRAFT_234555 [Daedaleopsis nitida]
MGARTSEMITTPPNQFNLQPSRADRAPHACCLTSHLDNANLARRWHWTTAAGRRDASGSLVSYVYGSFRPLFLPSLSHRAIDRQVCTMVRHAYVVHGTYP